MQKKLSYIIAELAAFKETYKQEIAAVPVHTVTSCEDDIDLALSCLEDAMFEINHQDGEHANSSAANYREYMAEENATTGREE